jgi:hypothetical protein
MIVAWWMPACSEESVSNHLIEVSNPWGRAIVLSSGQWLGHIVAQHPEMEALFDIVTSAIMEPDVVTFDALHRARENFYRFDARGRLLLKVCVHVSAQPEEDTATGIIETAYLTGRVKPKERVKWSSNT